MSLGTLEQTLDRIEAAPSNSRIIVLKDDNPFARRYNAVFASTVKGAKTLREGKQDGAPIIGVYCCLHDIAQVRQELVGAYNG